MLFPDLFPGWSLEEILRFNELALMGAMILISLFALGAVNISASAKIPSKF